MTRQLTNRELQSGGVWGPESGRGSSHQSVYLDAGGVGARAGGWGQGEHGACGGQSGTGSTQGKMGAASFWGPLSGIT